MKKRILSVFLCIVMTFGIVVPCTALPASAAVVEVASTSATASQTNMSRRADAVYNATWTAKATCYGWRGNYTYSKGSSYRVPYGQPVSSGKYVGYGISYPDFLKATTDASNIFYTGKSEYAGAKSTYYANDCSSFVSYCWGLSNRQTTSSIPALSTNLGKCTSANVDKLQLGDALNLSGSHVVIVSKISYTSTGAVSSVDITEQTPPQIKRTTYTRSGLYSKYSSYSIQRYSGSVSAPTFTISYDANGGSGSMSNQTINYGVSTALTANKFTKSGYQLKGWHAYRTATKKWYYTNGDTKGWYESGSQPSGYSLYTYKDGASVSKVGYGLSDTVTMKAVWEQAGPSKFTLTFDANGGTGTMSKQTVEYGSTATINSNTFKKDGATFSGWYAYRDATGEYRYRNIAGDKGWYKKGEQPTGYYRQRLTDGSSASTLGLGTGDNVTLTATWGLANYTVKYDANGGSGTLSDMSAIAGCEKALRKNTFTKSGNTFGGWTFTRSSDGKAYYILNSTTKKWYTPGSQPAGYRRLIYTDQLVISKLTTTEGDVVTASAYWIPNSTGTKTFYIDYDANGGTGTMKRTTVVKGESTATRANTFTKSGYTFAGWMAYRKSDDTWRFKDAEGASVWAKYGEQASEYTNMVTYKDGVSVASTSSVDCDIITFYASWVKEGTAATTAPPVEETVAPTTPAATYSPNPYGDGNGIRAHGIDVSKWQDNKIDFAKVKSDGYSFVIIRAGYSAGDSHTLTTDPYFESYYTKAKAAGMDVGVYWYSKALTAAEALSEAQYCENLLKGKKFEYPIYYDFEDPCQESLSASAKKTVSRKWMDYIASKGYLVGMYAGMYWFANFNPYTYIPDYECWAAKYYTSDNKSYAKYKEYESKYGMWQYTDEGKSSGYSGGLDMSVCFRDYPTIVKTYGYNGYSATTVTPTFKITFDANGGTGTMADQTVNYGTSTKVNANKFKKDGATFEGWYVYRNATKEWRYRNLAGDKGWYKKGSQPAGYYRQRYADETSVTTTGLGTGDTVTFTATWGTANYTVKYDANGGSGELSNMAAIAGCEKALRKNTFTKSKHTFGGWSFTRESDGKAYYILNSSTKSWYKPGQQPEGYRRLVYQDEGVISKLSNVEGDVVTASAYWIPNTTGTTTFYIDYDANGGTGTMKRTTVVKGESTATRTNTFVRDGYKFLGWKAYRSSDDKWRFKSSTVSTDQWALYGEQTSEYDLIVTYPDGVSVANTTKVDCDVITFYAAWEKIPKFTFVFDGNGGTGKMADQEVIYGEDTPISLNKFTRPGYKFVGWTVYRESSGKYKYTDGTTSKWYAEGSEPTGYTKSIYGDGITVSKTGTGDDDIVKLTAVWEEDFKFTFKFDANGGTGTMPDQLVKYGVDTPVNKNQFVRKGYKFVGWEVFRQATGLYRYKNSAGTIKWFEKGKQTDGYEISIYKDEVTVSKTGLGLDDVVILTAVWEEDFKFTFVFKPNGGTGTMADQTITYGTPTNMSKNLFTYDGYVFVGWNVYRADTDQWRYKSSDGSKSGWYQEGEEPEGYVRSLYKDEVSVSKTGTGYDDIVYCYAVWEEAPEPELAIGDLDGDDKIGIRDVTLLQRFLSGAETLATNQLNACDVNQDGDINVRDCTYMQKLIAGIIK